jgi:methionyl-tRNA formyltransferase
MDDPIHTLPFIKKIIAARRKEIVGLAITRGGRLTLGKKRSKIGYIFSLLLIMGCFNFFKNSAITIYFRIRKTASRFLPFIPNPSITSFAEQNGIECYFLRSPNDKNFIDKLKRMNVDVIINQGQSILKKKLLSTPRIGVINRHNALLPKNRGRLTPFWVLYKREKETGVSIHFVDEGIDSGDIIVQERFPVKEKDNFNTLAKKNYQVADKAMIKALELLEKGDFQLKKNDDNLASYNTIPTLREALIYRLRRVLRKKPIPN